MDTAYAGKFMLAWSSFFPPDVIITLVIITTVLETLITLHIVICKSFLMIAIIPTRKLPKKFLFEKKSSVHKIEKILHKVIKINKIMPSSVTEEFYTLP